MGASIFDKVKMIEMIAAGVKEIGGGGGAITLPPPGGSGQCLGEGMGAKPSNNFFLS